MIRALALMAAGTLVGLVFGACAASRPIGSGPFVPASERLFDGKSLAGWTQRGGKAAYRVEKGAIVGATRPNQPNSFLCTNAEFGDFILELEFKVDADLNSGVQFRSQSLPEYHDGQVHGYQVEIDPSVRAWTGGIYEEGRRGWLASLETKPDARAAFRPGRWNSMRVEARGDLIQTWINGIPTAELRDSMTPRGFIGLQVHGVGARTDELTVRWRGLRMQRLD